MEKLGPFLHYPCGLAVERHRRLRRPGGHYERQISGLGMGQRTARCHQIPVSPLQYIAAGPRFSLGSNEGSCSRIFPNFQTNLENEAGIPCGNIGFLTLLGVPQLPPPLSSAHVPHEPGYPCSSRQSSSSKYSTHSTPLPLHRVSTFAPSSPTYSHSPLTALPSPTTPPFPSVRPSPPHSPCCRPGSFRNRARFGPARSRRLFAACRSARLPPGPAASRPRRRCPHSPPRP